MNVKNVCDLNSVSCTGCGACTNVCPLNLLKVEENDKGFQKIFIINSKKCISCGACLKVCHRNSLIKKQKSIAIYAIRNKNKDELNKSSSGGFFPALARYVINGGGCVYGAGIDESFVTRHVEINKISEIIKLQKSKYVQSITAPIYFSILNNIKKGRTVLFVGTPCQVSSLRLFLNYMKVDVNKCIFVDVLCYGTPSKKIVRDYIDTKTKRGNITEVVFRDENGPDGHIQYENKIERMTELAHLFGMKYSLTDNCFSCAYKTLERVSDISIGDFWGLDSVNPDFYDKVHTSMVMVNSKKGAFYFNEVKHCFLYILPTLYEGFFNKYQPSLIRNFKKPDKYDLFWSFYGCKGFTKTYNYFISRKLFYRIARRFLVKA